MKRIIATIGFVIGFAATAHAQYIGPGSPYGIPGLPNTMPTMPQYNPPPLQSSPPSQTWTGMNLGGGISAWSNGQGHTTTCIDLGVAVHCQ